MIESFAIVDGRLVLHVRVDVVSHVRIHGLDGAFGHEVRLPAIGTVSGFSGRRSHSEGFYAFTSYTYPTTIFRYDFASKTVTNLTEDEYYDGNPVWSADGKSILYNRRIGSFAKIFSVTVGAPERKIQLTGGASGDIQPTYSRDGQWVYFTSDRGAFGVFNLHRLEIATGKIERLTDLVGGAFTPVEMTSDDDGTPRLVNRLEELKKRLPARD